ncbi:MAG: hypothetical protein IM333_05100 [Microcystis sp. M048S1]|uniref:hypothetical protein n=1 Tax=unclassified Microcystis TaxID=2643300 RepID=UPI0011921FE2|nr:MULTISPECIES: hypothetical protein [unclassified Microcystis]MCA2901859.1 hypothetical protein [Microcystis sp. M035S1]MCA2722798.1 hypothetical protein [Microcystis sp. M176S2]MCA2725447.1 hypothetical protein [Microcystis sp. M166S2]MCA2729574.1 hypothetical protein [Microcystis sp. M162S2]MCA2745452.1 hypothetical protein [Microcystis sp. M155S2]
MNNRLCLHLIANKEKGFALPLAVLIGLILMVTGMTMMMRAQGDQSKVIAQKARADSLTSSEVGLARVQDLLNSVRVMATVDRNCPSGGDCWQNAEVVANPSTDLQKHLKKLVDAAPSCSNPNDADTLKAKIGELRDLSADKWVDLGNNRYYRVDRYDYRIETGMGVLTLEGLSRKSAATDLTNIAINRDSDDNAASRNRVVVTIPILDAPTPAFNRSTVPALWISEGTADNGAKFEGDVVEVVARPECDNKPDKIQQPTPALNPPYTAQFVGVFFPKLPETPTSLPSGQKDLVLTSSETFPRKDADNKIVDTPSTRTIDGKSVQVYEYIVNNINLSSGQITIEPGQRVVFYVRGNINGAIKHDCGSVTGCKPGNLQIYADNNLNSPAPQICLRGDQTLQAFIFAPDYSLGKTGTGTFIGAAWGKNWGKISDCPSNSGAVAVTQRVEWTELITNLKPQFPQLGGVDNWCEEPIDTAAGASKCVPN